MAEALREPSSGPEVRAEVERGPVLVLAPHADDEVIGCGGALALHARQGDSIRVVVVFDGALGDPTGRLGADEIVAARRREAIDAARVLDGGNGAIEYEFWGHPEGHEPSDADLGRAVDRLADGLSRQAPRSVYAPWPGDDHRDHRNVACAVLEALRASDFDGDAWGYEVWSALEPDRVLDVTAVAEIKARALQEHATQNTGGDLAHRALGLGAWRSSHLPAEGRFAEAFCRLVPAAPTGRSAGGTG